MPDYQPRRKSTTTLSHPAALESALWSIVLNPAAMIGLAGAGLVTASIAFGWTAYQRGRELVAADSQVVSLRSAVATLADEKRGVASRLAQETLALHNTTRELQDSRTALDKSKSALRDANSANELLAGERNAAVTASQKATAAAKLSAEQMLDHWSSLAPQLAGDPELCRRVWLAAQRAATEAGRDSSPIAASMARLPVPQRLSGDHRLSVVTTSVEGNTVIVEVTVFDRRGRFVSGLGRVDVDVHRGADRLHALSLHETSIPTGSCDIALLVDASASTAGAAHDAAVQAAVQFVDGLPSPIRVRVWRFADEVEALTPWTFDAEVHRDAIRSMTASGGTALNKGLRLAAENLTTRTGARAIVLFTDGSDSFRKEPIDPVLTLCRQAEIPVHVVALQTRETNDALLQRISTTTEGTLQLAARPEQLGEKFHSVSELFHRPVYRIRIEDGRGDQPLTLRIAGLPMISIPANP